MCVDLVGCQSVNVGTVMPLRVCMSPQRLRLGRLRGRGDVRRAASCRPLLLWAQGEDLELQVWILHVHSTFLLNPPTLPFSPSSGVSRGYGASTVFVEVGGVLSIHEDG